MVKKISTTVILVAALLAITVVALAAGSLIFGWVDFYKDGYNVDVHFMEGQNTDLEYWKRLGKYAMNIHS